MAGEHEPPVRYRGEPPRYSERVVDPENPVQARPRTRTGHDDEWGIEAYAPGLPRSEYGGAPADWDDVPLRPARRRARREEGERARPDAAAAPEHGGRATGHSRTGAGVDGAGRTRGAAAPRRETDRRPAPEYDAPQRRPGGDRISDERGSGSPRRRGDDAASPGSGGERSMRRAEPEPGRRRPANGDRDGSAGRDENRRGAGDASGARGRAGGDAIESERNRGGRTTSQSARDRSADGREAERPSTRPRRAAGSDGSSAPRRALAENTETGNDVATTGATGLRTSSRIADAEDSADRESRGAEHDTVTPPTTSGTRRQVAGGTRPSPGDANSPTARRPVPTHHDSPDHGADLVDGDRAAPAEEAERGDSPAADFAGSPESVRSRASGPADAAGGVCADDGIAARSGGEPTATSRGADDDAAHDNSAGARTRRRVGGPEDRSDDREMSYAHGTPQSAELPAGFDQVSPETRGGRYMTGDYEPAPRRSTRTEYGAGTARRRTETPPARRTGRGQRTLRDRNGSKMASYEQLSRASRADGEAGNRRDRRNKPAKKKNQGPPLLDDAARARLEAVAREGAGLRAAWAAFRIRTDDLRRVNAAARIESVVEDGFDRGTAQLTDRGYVGAGGGRMNVVGRPVEYRATTAQVAGLWPWSVGAGAPLIGTPLGSHLHTGAPVCFDPMNWFMRGSFITAPSLFVLGLNGFGKSSLVRRIVLGGVAQGITPLILADVKPDYRKLVEMVGGQVIDLGYGHGKLNPLAGGVLGSIVPLLADLPELQLQVTQELRARQVTLIAGLVELVRGARVRDYEETLISTALRILYREGSGFAPESPPIMEDLLEVVVGGGQELMLDAGADTTEEYHEATKGLRRSLRALTQGPFGAVFNGQTTTPIDTSSVAVCIDVSHIPTGDKKLKAGVMLACWADGFASVEAAHVLADGKLGPQRYFQVVMDELWQVLGLGDFMVDRVDELTRLQRGMATSLIMISHTIKDLQSLGSEAAIAKALGFLERARAKIFGALPPEEISRLDSTIPFTSAEEEMVTSWSAPQALTGEALKPGQARPPAPGTGKFLLKIGEDRRPGIPFHMEFTVSEKESGIHETNQRFSEFTESTARRGDEGSAA
ncbi:hypothetical protein [Nocardia cerradoensis]|uniref:hypothetical protein n=2 Tax=Nocardia cerradoensis TaxID=85688 RepID=UPI001FD0C511|nr:hypothetical protein [Nocardia cerradoensis]